ncbi:MAG: type 4a pilus biogenesis protein PilO [Phycisphaerae bacterium]|nr:type 4a pilus biogenesis protein PilO [Phycisphaerae bacterium]
MKNLRKDQWLTIAIVGVVVTTFALVIYLPQRHQLKDLRKECAAADETLQRDRSKLSELTQLRGQVDRATRQMEVYNRRLPESQDLGQFLKDVSNYAQLCGLEGASFQPQKPQGGEMYNQLPIAMRFKGSFGEVFRFLRQTRSMPRVTNIRTLSLHNDPKLEGQCAIDLAMVIFYTR